jgi:hypothetical protein
VSTGCGGYSYGRLDLFVSPSSCVLECGVRFSVQQGQDTGQQSLRRLSPDKSLFIVFLVKDKRER